MLRISKWLLGHFKADNIKEINDIINQKEEDKPEYAKRLYSAQQIITINGNDVYYWFDGSVDEIN